MMKDIPMGKAKVIKNLIDLPSGHKAEAIYFNRPEKQVICFSTQLSCAVGCVFCASPNETKTINLTTTDMLHQIQMMRMYAEEDKVMLYSIMGEGEPLLNFKNVVGICSYLATEYIITEEPYRISLSTSGVKASSIVNLADYVVRMKKDVDEKFNFKLQLSLHAPNDDIRREIIPLAASSINELIEALTYFRETTGSSIDVNYMLMKDVNDSHKNAVELADRFKDFHIKISKYNYVEGLPYKSSDKDRMFLDILDQRGVSHEYHMTDGEDIFAACGQTSAAKHVVEVSDNPSGQYCPACRAVGMYHCSDPVNCGGMHPMKKKETDGFMNDFSNEPTQYEG